MVTMAERSGGESDYGAGEKTPKQAVLGKTPYDRRPPTAKNAKSHVPFLFLRNIVVKPASKLISYAANRFFLRKFLPLHPEAEKTEVGDVSDLDSVILALDVHDDQLGDKSNVMTSVDISEQKQEKGNDHQNSVAPFDKVFLAAENNYVAPLEASTSTESIGKTDAFQHPPPPQKKRAFRMIDEEVGDFKGETSQKKRALRISVEEDKNFEKDDAADCNEVAPTLFSEKNGTMEASPTDGKVAPPDDAAQSPMDNSSTLTGHLVDTSAASSSLSSAFLGLTSTAYSSATSQDLNPSSDFASTFHAPCIYSRCLSFSQPRVSLDQTNVEDIMNVDPVMQQQKALYQFNSGGIFSDFDDLATWLGEADSLDQINDKDEMNIDIDTVVQQNQVFDKVFDSFSSWESHMKDKTSMDVNTSAVQQNQVAASQQGPFSFQKSDKVFGHFSSWANYMNNKPNMHVVQQDHENSSPFQEWGSLDQFDDGENSSGWGVWE